MGWRSGCTRMIRPITCNPKLASWTGLSAQSAYWSGCVEAGRDCHLEYEYLDRRVAGESLHVWVGLIPPYAPRRHRW